MAAERSAQRKADQLAYAPVVQVEMTFCRRIFRGQLLLVDQPYGILGRNVKMDYFAFFLSRVMDRTVVDRTALPARYDVALQFVPENRLRAGDGAGGPELTPGCSDIQTALPRQLGLRLDAGKGPVEYLVVEHAEKPTEN